MSVEQLRFHEIAEADNAILNPFTKDQLALLGRVCRLRPGQRQLDLACGKGEMLCDWADEFEITGVGVDLSSVFLTAARRRAEELDLTDRLAFVQGDAAAYQAEPGAFDVVSCIGASWIGNGLAGTLALMRAPLRDGGLLLVGEPFWHEEPPAEAYPALETSPGEFVSLAETAERLVAAGFDLVEMVLANQDGWDRYIAPHWWAIDRWLREHPEHPDAPALRQFGEAERAGHLAYGRRYLGWGVFVLRAAS
ncbi:MAG: class I SAM-dependent methyltransferase [Dactylosporangium sp.]|nr:class I SAM-dependent methyltransferase [Dactylosporangium sp.]NNJ61246.1 class I SAM-dependent methyltransferase [Dactylosporangium sp.]